MKKKLKPKKENGERWLLTYADLITLLMILFILLYAMSTVDQEKYNELSTAMSDSMGEGAGIFKGTDSILPEGGHDSVVDLGNGTVNSPSDSIPDVTEAPSDLTKTPEATNAPQGSEETQGSGEISGKIDTEQDMKNFESYINDILKDMNIGVSAGTTIVESGLIISFANDVFFDSGQDKLKADMKKGLSEIAKLLNQIDNAIVIEGHTDNVPISANNKYTSNWQLSAVRAANVAQYLVENEKVDGIRITAAGYGEYHPVASNDTIKGKSKNRRVDITILYDKDTGLD